VEIHHRDGDRRNERRANLVLLHAHCHDQAHAGLYHWQGPACWGAGWGETFTSGSESAVGRATAPPTVTTWRRSAAQVKRKPLARLLLRVVQFRTCGC